METTKRDYEHEKDSLGDFIADVVDAATHLANFALKQKSLPQKNDVDSGNK